MTKILGMDISLNHGGMVLLEDGKLKDFWYYTTLVGSAKQHVNGYRIEHEIFKNKDNHILSVKRLNCVSRFIETTILNSMANYACLEDYATGADQGAHALGEIGGITRLLLYNKEIPFRLHDPKTAKMFVTHYGGSSKDLVQDSVLKRWNVDFNRFDQPMANPTKNRPNPKQNKQTSEDLADAFGLAMLLWTELELKTGNIELSSLHKKEKRIFTRKTKKFPAPLLERNLIY